MEFEELKELLQNTRDVSERGSILNIMEQEHYDKFIEFVENY